MKDDTWIDVDRYIEDLFLGSDPVLEFALKKASEAGLPSINVSPTQGKMLNLLVQMQRAQSILEIGTLGGYSTIWMARALPQAGHLITLEINELHAQVARANIENAGLSDKVTVTLGPAAESLEKLISQGAGPFDFVFIDADKPGNPDYFRLAMKLTRPGSVIVVDNVIRDGAVVQADATDPAVIGTRELNRLVAAETTVSATQIQTVGSKGYDGFALIVVQDG